jgi:hypothetical protein
MLGNASVARLRAVGGFLTSLRLSPRASGHSLTNAISFYADAAKAGGWGFCWYLAEFDAVARCL